MKKKITKEDYFKNIFEIGNYRRDVQEQNLGKELMNQRPGLKEKTWGAYYSDKNNKVYILAGYVHDFLKIGLKSDIPKALLYGGSALGHEIMHGFEGEGRKWDDQGRKIQWWSNRENDEYEKRTQCLVGKYLFQ